jgi:hypothetical protein
MFKVGWLRNGKNYDIGEAPLFVPSPGEMAAGRYVAEQIWPRIHRNHPEVSGFVLLEMESGHEVFRWLVEASPHLKTDEAGSDNLSAATSGPTQDVAI